MFIFNCLFNSGPINRTNQFVNSFVLNLCLRYVETLNEKKKVLDRFYFVISGELLEGYNNFREQYRNSREETSHFAFSNFWCVNFATHGPCVIAIEDCTFFFYSPFFFGQFLRDNLIKLFPRP